ncbi:unnamed protein product [Rhodiola kirilowii]
MASTSGTKFSDQDELQELLHEQREEFAAAALMETDFDLAYNLQLQEAIKASIGSAPSSSLSMEKICFDSYSRVEGLSVEASVNETENDVRVLMKFMEDDVERVEQEVSDQELSEAEARRMRDDLNRRLHDQKVAAAIFAMPEEEWAKSGEYFGKPYGEGSYSDGMEVDENFRVYVKGLVSEERVRDAVVTVAGIGVAICDPSDYCILELRKPLVDGDDSSKSVLSAERVGFEALVEGLKAADDLGLKRVSCFCDDNMIHQYVSTNQVSTDLKITMLAFEALTLRKKLVHFEITLVGRNEMKMASKLAKEAIVSQICIPAETIKGPDATVAELTDFICAAQMARASDIHFIEQEEKKPSVGCLSKLKRRKNQDYDALRKKRHRFGSEEDDELIRLPKPMIGFGVPTESFETVHRTIPEAAKGPPYFYYENVALAPKGVWNTISRFLYDIEPEFVDSKFFCACARKRGYIHNLPIENRFPLVPLPALTILEAFPLTKRWWPAWDTRTKLNCLQTSIGSAKMTERIRKSLEDCGDDDPPLHVQRYVMDLCRKWNLLWVGTNKLAPLEPDEFETLLGFPKNHTRGGGISRTDRYKSLGNSFQVDTVAYHLSVLKDMYPGGINVLSLFSGIGGAEIALHRLGIPLKTVVEVEISEANRNIMRSWWEQTNQRGTLIDMSDVTQLDAEKLEQLIDSFGGFDLVVGGSPCNNLAGSNRVSRDGLEGKESSLFYDYFRILDLVKSIMRSRSSRY